MALPSYSINSMRARQVCQYSLIKRASKNSVGRKDFGNAGIQVRGDLLGIVPLANGPVS